MILGNAWGLLALLGLPVLVGLHLFRHRFRERSVSGLFLWGQPLVQGGSGRRRDRLRGLLSLLAECAALLAITWYLCDPHLATARPAVHHVVLLDGHARLLARRDDGQSVGERLLEDLRGAWRALPDGDRITLIRTGLRPRLLAGPLVAPAEALAALERPLGEFFDQSVHDLREALDLAVELAGDGEGRLLLASDRPWSDLPQRCGLLARGQPRRHSGLVDARWWRDGEGERLHLNLVNSGPMRTRELVLRAVDGSVLQRRMLQLPADDIRSLTLSLSDPPESLVLLLGPDPADHLPIDDHVELLRPPRRTVRVHIEPELSGLDPLQRVLASLADVEPVARPIEADLLIGQRQAEPQPGSWRLRIADAGGPPQLGPFLARRGHPLMTAVDGRAVLWSGGAPLSAIGEADVLLAAGEMVLIDERRRGRERLLRWHCRLQNSNLHQQPLWPVLFHNLMSERRAHLIGPATASIPATAPLRCCLPPGAGEAELQGPDGSRTVSADAEGLVTLPPLQRPGRYQLRSNGRLISTIEVHGLDPRMSDLAPCRDLQRRGPALGEAAGDRRRDDLAHLLPVLLAGLAAVLAWLAWNREERLVATEAPR